MATKVLSGGAKLAEHLAELSKKANQSALVKVGFLEGSTYDDSTPVAMVAAIQEFGAPAKGIPPRSFFRDMIANEEGHWGADLGAILKHEGYDSTLALSQMGELMAGELRESVINTNSPELSPVTLLLRERFGNNPQEIKFSDVLQAWHDIANGEVSNVTPTQAKPLVWTGHMLNSIDKEVE